MYQRNQLAWGVMTVLLALPRVWADDGIHTPGTGNDRLESHAGRRCDPSNPDACGRPEFFCRVPAGHCGSADARGVCTPVPRTCSGEGAPVCGCDGNTYKNRCEAARVRVSIQHEGRCHRECDRSNGNGCEVGEYCRLPVGVCDSQDVKGICAAVPAGCPDVDRPVCGCDGMTYGNRCEAAMAGASVAHRGPCWERCDREHLDVCDDGQFCHFPPGTCDAADAQGQCTPIPDACPEIYDPVCGCDGNTYSSRCHAAIAGVSTAHPGECHQVCDGFAGFPCDEGEFCLHHAGECMVADGQGICVHFPGRCPPVHEPVCGCDGETYQNPCEAIRAGVQIDHRGPCVQVCDGFAGVRCDEGEFCLHRPGQCNVADGQGVCVNIPRECRPIREPVCGCDGHTYANECLAVHAGVQIDHPGHCRE